MKDQICIALFAAAIDAINCGEVWQNAEEHRPTGGPALMTDGQNILLGAPLDHWPEDVAMFIPLEVKLPQEGK